MSRTTQADRDAENFAIRAIRAAYPAFNWDRFDDLNRSVNWELWHGVLPDDYWTDVEPLEHYEWAGYEQAERDLIALLADLPADVWIDHNCDAECACSDKEPEEFEECWDHTETVVDPETGDVTLICGMCDGEGYVAAYLENTYRRNVWETILHEEVWKQIR